MRRGRLAVTALLLEFGEIGVGLGEEPRDTLVLSSCLVHCVDRDDLHRQYVWPGSTSHRVLARHLGLGGLTTTIAPSL